MSIKDKIPRIEYVLVMPEEIENNFNCLIDFYKNNMTKSLKILKKQKHRITTEDFVSSPKFNEVLKEIFGNELYEKINEENSIGYNPELNEISQSEDSIDNLIGLIKDSKLDTLDNEKKQISKEDILDEFKLLLNKKDNIFKNNIGKKLVEYIEKIVEKYLKIIIHLDDQIFVITDKNKDSNKLFVKFFLPKIMTDKEHENNKYAIDEINKNKDNIHATILPTVDGHGLDGIFHLTFRIEGKNKTWFEYSKYLSINRESNKLGFIVYNDNTCTDYVIFKLTSNFDKLLELLKSNKISDVMENFFESKVYSDLCDFIVYDIFLKLMSDQKIDMFLTRYFHIVGIKIINSIINKLLKVVFLTFIELSCI
jgi:hypothetical protein